MKSFEDLVAKVQFELRYNAPANLVEKQLEYSLVEFSRKSSALKETVLIPSFPDLFHINIASDTYPGVISSVREVTVAGRKIDKSLWAFNEAHSELWIDVAANATGQEVSANAIVVPSGEYRDYPESFFAAYGPGVAGHACFELSADESEPWARPARAAIFLKSYEDAVNQARRRNFSNLKISVG